MCDSADHDHEHSTDTEQAREHLQLERRSFLKGAVVSGGAAATLAAIGFPRASMAQQKPGLIATSNHYYVPASAETVHWGYFSKTLKPLVEVESGDFVTIETLTHHAGDDLERMVKGDPGAESVYLWTKDRKGVDRRGAGPMDASIFGRGAGEGSLAASKPLTAGTLNG